jgi:PAS domain S-box-containing protein
LELRNVAEKELRKHRDNLDTLVKDRTVKLTEANKRLEEEIADRQQTQDELKKSEDRFRNLVETTNDWIWELDSKLAYTYVGPKILDILGYSPEEVLGKSLFDLMAADEAGRVREVWTSLTSAPKPFTLIEKTCLHKNGDPVILETSGVPVFDASGMFQGYRGIDRDITTRKWAEEFIRLSKKDWEETFDTIDDIITIHDKNFNILRVNKAAESAFGMNVREIVSTKCFHVFHGQRSRPDNCPSCQCLETKKPVTFEYFEPNLDRYLEIKAIPRLDPDDEVLGIIHIVRDISERKRVDNELLRHREQLSEMVQEKTSDLTSAISLLNDEITSRRQAEEALRVSEKKYRDLYNNAPDMYHTLNSDLIIIDCNETEAQMLGYRKEEIIGRPLADFFTEESRVLLQRDYPVLKEKKVLKNLERTFIRKDRTTFSAILNVFADVDEQGNIKGSRAIARDITDLKRSENELKNVNRTLKALSDFNNALLHVNEESSLLDETCRIIVNTGSYKMAWVGYAENNNRRIVRPVAHTGDATGYLKAVTITWDGPDRAMEPAGRVILSRNTCISRNLRIDADFIPWCAEVIRRGYKSTLSIPLFENEEVIGSLNIYAENADAFDAEEIDLLEKLAENLSYGIAVLRSNVERKRAEAEAMRAGHLASLGELAAGVAHEINNPINGIINYAEILLKKNPQHSRERDISARIIKEGDRIANIVRSLLSFARDNREEKKPVKVNEILSEALALTEAQLRKDGITLLTHLPDDLPLLFVQPHQIEQVFLNLISNARYALNQRFPRKHPDKILKIHGAPIMVEGRDYIRIMFHDRGTGIPDDIKAKIMNPFFSTKPGSIGTGLGLSISHGIVTNHSGKIVIDSAQGKYTKVIVDLPAYVSKT